MISSPVYQGKTEGWCTEQFQTKGVKTVNWRASLLIFVLLSVQYKLGGSFASSQLANRSRCLRQFLVIELEFFRNLIRVFFRRYTKLTLIAFPYYLNSTINKKQLSVTSILIRCLSEKIKLHLKVFGWQLFPIYLHHSNDIWKQCTLYWVKRRSAMLNW